MYFVSKITKKTSEQHPLDGYFFELVRRASRLESCLWPSRMRDSFAHLPWIDNLAAFGAQDPSVVNRT